MLERTFNDNHPHTLPETNREIVEVKNALEVVAKIRAIFDANQREVISLEIMFCQK